VGKLKLVKGKSVTWAENATMSVTAVLVTLPPLPLVSSFPHAQGLCRWGEPAAISRNNSICRLLYFSWDFLFSVLRYG